MQYLLRFKEELIDYQFLIQNPHLTDHLFCFICFTFLHPPLQIHMYHVQPTV